ncbi:MAG: GDP-mannose 4,6-dehydratase [Desulfatirhabdiaceae bacterium]
MNERAVIIGSNSFSGASFADYLITQGVDTIGISRSPEPHPVFLPYKKRNSSLFQFVQLDINHDLPEIMQVIDTHRPDYVVNFASQSMVAESWQNPVHWFQTNVVSTVALHDQLRKKQSLKKYVHISTPEVYGSCDGLVRENTNYNPSTPYSVSRAASDMSLMTFFRAYGFPVVFTRAANVYGPCQALYRIIPRTILFFLTDRKLMLHGGGHSVRSFIHIRDVADGTLRAARIANPGEIFHFSTERNIAIKNLVEMIALQVGVSVEKHVEIVEERPGKDAAYLLDSSKAKEKLLWQDQIILEQGIEETIAWVRDNLKELQKQPPDYIHKP